MLQHIFAGIEARFDLERRHHLVGGNQKLDRIRQHRLPIAGGTPDHELVREPPVPAPNAPAPRIGKRIARMVEDLAVVARAVDDAHLAPDDVIDGAAIGRRDSRDVGWRPDGIVVYDKQKCIGCQMCSWQCPYGIPRYSAEDGTIEMGGQARTVTEAM